MVAVAGTGDPTHRDLAVGETQREEAPGIERVELETEAAADPLAGGETQRRLLRSCALAPPTTVPGILPRLRSQHRDGLEQRWDPPSPVPSTGGSDKSSRHNSKCLVCHQRMNHQ
ncbi:unnamed protein product [Closterium sp. NIES-65]|nr:unnamed protein product [Closterium sp. NIES-65]